jgi:hypothetical protein
MTLITWIILVFLQKSREVWSGFVTVRHGGGNASAGSHLTVSPECGVLRSAFQIIPTRRAKWSIPSLYWTAHPRLSTGRMARFSTPSGGRRSGRGPSHNYPRVCLNVILSKEQNASHLLVRTANPCYQALSEWYLRRGQYQRPDVTVYDRLDIAQRFHALILTSVLYSPYALFRRRTSRMMPATKFTLGTLSM